MSKGMHKRPGQYNTEWKSHCLVQVVEISFSESLRGAFCQSKSLFPIWLFGVQIASLRSQRCIHLIFNNVLVKRNDGQKVTVQGHQCVQKLLLIFV